MIEEQNVFTGLKEREFTYRFIRRLWRNVKPVGDEDEDETDSSQEEEKEEAPVPQPQEQAKSSKQSPESASQRGKKRENLLELTDDNIRDTL